MLSGRTLLALAALLAPGAAASSGSADVPTGPRVVAVEGEEAHQRGPWHLHGSHSRAGRPGPVGFILSRRTELGLSEDQVRELRRLAFEARRDLIRRVAELRVAELELAELRLADPVDMGRVEAKLREIEQRRTELRLQLIQAAERAKAQLTAEQRARLRSLVLERLDRDRRGRPPGDRGAVAPHAPLASPAGA